MLALHVVSIPTPAGRDLKAVRQLGWGLWHNVAEAQGQDLAGPVADVADLQKGDG